MSVGHNSAVRGTFSDFKTVKTRGVCQLIIEVPIEAADNALSLLGGVPQAKAEQWVGIAPVTAPEAPAETERDNTEERTHAVHRSWGELSPTQQAGIACCDPAFQRWTSAGAEPSEECAARLVRHVCKVESRAQLSIYPEAATAWGRLYEEFKASQRGDTPEAQEQQLHRGPL